MQANHKKQVAIPSISSPAIDQLKATLATIQTGIQFQEVKIRIPR